MAVEFLGHKEGLLPFVAARVQEQVGEHPTTFLDLFAGTAAVAAHFKSLGYSVIANDNLVLCQTFSEAALLNRGIPQFEEIVPQLSRQAANVSERLFAPSPYGHVLAYLNALPPEKGFIYSTYSPASQETYGVSRMYFTRENAGRIDAIRTQIDVWEREHLLTQGEKALLLRDLILAANAVSNIAGTYGCYLKQWKPRSRRPLQLVEFDVPCGSPGREHRVHGLDANEVVRAVPSSVVYADPPYTKRQYAAYYHLLETIAIGDSPEVSGRTGLRPWEDKASDYCYKRKAPGALQDLVQNVRCDHFFLSYNDDGQIPHEQILEILSPRGEVTVFEAEVRRYKSSRRPHKGNAVVERLYYVAVESLGA